MISLDRRRLNLVLLFQGLADPIGQIQIHRELDTSLTLRRVTVIVLG